MLRHHSGSVYHIILHQYLIIFASLHLHLNIELNLASPTASQFSSQAPFNTWRFIIWCKQRYFSYRPIMFHDSIFCSFFHEIKKGPSLTSQFWLSAWLSSQKFAPFHSTRAWCHSTLNIFVCGSIFCPFFLSYFLPFCLVSFNF